MLIRDEESSLSKDLNGGANNGKPVIQTENLWKNFWIRHNRNDSLKEKFIGLFNRDRRENREEIWALQNINIEVGKGEMVGIIGPNGSGKSTLLQLVAGVYSPTKGTVNVEGEAAPLIELGVGFHPELTGRENIYLNTSLYGLSSEETEEIYDDIVQYSELDDFIDAKVKAYSSGMYMRLGFSILTQLEPDVMLIDEVLAVGDEKFQKKCLDTMKKFRDEGKTILFVTHNLDLVKDLCDRAYLLEDGEVKKEGPAEEVTEYYLQDG